MTFIAQHLYLLAALYFSFWSVVFFLVSKNGRREILLAGLMGMVLGPLVQQMHLVDWWHPHFLFNTPIKLEDVLFGFSIPGVAVAVYNILRPKITSRQKMVPLVLKFSVVCVATLLLFGSFYWFGFSSFWSSIISLCVPLCVIAVMKPRLLVPAFLTGVLLVILVTPGYLFGIYINPDWVQNEWLLGKLSGIFVFGIPIEELFWFLFVGAGLSISKEILFSPSRIPKTNRITKSSRIEDLLNPDLYQVFLMQCPAKLPISPAVHTWFVTNRIGTVTRCGILSRKARTDGKPLFGGGKHICNNCNQYLHKDDKPPPQSVGIFPFLNAPVRGTRVIGCVEGGEGSLAARMAIFIEQTSAEYPYAGRYFFLGPNSNTYPAWVLSHFPESGIRLPWNAVGKHWWKRDSTKS